MTGIPYFGEICSLLSAVVWAAAVIFFKKSGEKVHPLALNLFKNLFALVLFTPTLFIAGLTLFPDVPTKTYLILLASGAIGIGFADTMFFQSLNLLGAGRSSIVGCLYSPFVIILAVIFLGESLSIGQIFGATLIVSAILVGTFEKDGTEIPRKNLLPGSIFGVLSMLGMAYSIVIAKPILNEFPLLWVNQIRLFGGVIILALFFLFDPKRMEKIKTIHSAGSWKFTLSGSFVGTYLALIVWLAGMKYTEASVSSVLNQTSQIFIFILATIFLKEKITIRKALGISLAFAGIFLATFG